MVAKAQNLIDYFRTLVWMDTLIEMLGLGPTGLDRLYFEKYASNTESSDATVGEPDRRFLRYMHGRSIPRPDPVIAINTDGSASMLKLDPLRAMELEAPGSARWFFHPLFNLMHERVVSSEAALERMMQREVPGFSEFRNFLDLMVSRVRRPRFEEPFYESRRRSFLRKEVASSFSLHMVREELLRLDEEIVCFLFKRDDDQYYRRRSSISREVNSLSREVSIGHLTAGIGLYLEAEFMVAPDRIQPIAELIEFQLVSIEEENRFKRIGKKLIETIRREFSFYTLPGYCPKLAEVNGYPASWRSEISNKEMKFGKTKPE